MRYGAHQNGSSFRARDIGEHNSGRPGRLDPPPASRGRVRCPCGRGQVVVCFVGFGILITFTGNSQRPWMPGVQKLVGLTATVIASMKSLKISGLTGLVTEYVQQPRINELAAGARYRGIMIIATTFSFIPQLIIPPLTLVFAQHPLNASTMFTSLPFLTLLIQPSSQLFQSIPELVSGLACLGRIQAFSKLKPRRDYR